MSDNLPTAAVTRVGPLAAQVRDVLGAQIADGRWPVGGRIPSEHELADHLAVSRGTVREALRSLTMIGVLEARVGDGTYVRATSELAGVLGRAQQDVPLREVLELRAVLEQAAARGAAVRRTDADVEDLRGCLVVRRTAHDAGDVDEYVDADSRFHALVARASGSTLLARVHDALGECVTASIRATTVLPEDPALGRAHSALVDAVERHDATAAMAAVEVLHDQVAAAAPPAAAPRR